MDKAEMRQGELIATRLEVPFPFLPLTSSLEMCSCCSLHAVSRVRPI